MRSCAFERAQSVGVTKNRPSQEMKRAPVLDGPCGVPCARAGGAGGLGDVTYLEMNVLEKRGRSPSPEKTTTLVMRYVFLGSSAISSSQAGSVISGFFASAGRRSSPAAGRRAGRVTEGTGWDALD